MNFTDPPDTLGRALETFQMPPESAEVQKLVSTLLDRLNALERKQERLMTRIRVIEGKVNYKKKEKDVHG